MRRAIGLVAVLLATAAGCDGLRWSSDETGKVIIVLFDLSGSTGTDRPIYQGALDRVIDALKPGDRFIMGPITSRSGADFLSSVDVTLPAEPKQSIIEEPIKYRRRAEEFGKEMESKKARLSESVRGFLAEKAAAQQTAIFESLRTIAPMFRAEKRRKVLVVLSDMIEESSVANFERTKLNDELIEKELERQRNAQILPDLSGVRVYVAGATASPPERAAAIERFWSRYFDETKAEIAPGRYGRTLSGFEE